MHGRARDLQLRQLLEDGNMGQRTDTEEPFGDNVVPSAQVVLNLKCPWTIHRVVCPDNVGADTTGQQFSCRTSGKI